MAVCRCGDDELSLFVTCWSPPPLAQREWRAWLAAVRLGLTCLSPQISGERCRRTFLSISGTGDDRVCAFHSLIYEDCPDQLTAGCEANTHHLQALPIYSTLLYSTLLYSLYPN
jgi:hypothetical protein